VSGIGAHKFAYRFSVDGLEAVLAPVLSYTIALTPGVT
jgi:hypothetical protein